MEIPIFNDNLDMMFNIDSINKLWNILSKQKISQEKGM